MQKRANANKKNGTQSNKHLAALGEREREHSARLQHPIHSDNIEHIMLSMARLNWDRFVRCYTSFLLLPERPFTRSLLPFSHSPNSPVPSWNAQAIFLASAWLECVYHKLCSFWHDITWRLFNTRMAMAFTFKSEQPASWMNWSEFECARGSEEERERIKWKTLTLYSSAKMPKQTNVFHVKSIRWVCMRMCFF